MKHVTVLSDVTNYVVVQTEGRRFPGLVVQGDRLREWARLAAGGDSDAIELLARHLADSLADTSASVSGSIQTDVPLPVHWRARRSLRSRLRRVGVIGFGTHEGATADEVRDGDSDYDA